MKRVNSGEFLQEKNLSKHTRLLRHGAFKTNTLKIHMESSNETWVTVYRSQQHITHPPL
jgi:hypothetical protein